MKVASKLELREALDDLWNNVQDPEIKNRIDGGSLKIIEDNHDMILFDRENLIKNAARER